jgi:hypothetical protein
MALSVVGVIGSPVLRLHPARQPIARVHDVIRFVLPVVAGQSVAVSGGIHEPAGILTGALAHRPADPQRLALRRLYCRAPACNHRRYRHADGRRVTLSFHHASDTFPPKTLRSILELQARWTEADLVRLKLF